MPAKLGFRMPHVVFDRREQAWTNGMCHRIAAFGMARADVHKVDTVSNHR